MEDVFVVFGAGVLQIWFPGGAPKAVALCPIGYFSFKDRSHPSTASVEHPSIKERGYQFTGLH